MPSLTDIARALEPDGTVTEIVNVLSRANPLLGDLQFREGNLPTGMTYSVWKSLPAAQKRRLNQGVAASSARSEQKQVGMSIWAGFNEVDIKAAKLAGGASTTGIDSYRSQELLAFVEGTSQEIATELIYGDETTDPDSINGLASYYGEISTDETNPGFNIIDGGGAASTNTSIYLVAHGLSSVFGIFPKGSKAGIDVIDRGVQIRDEVVGGVNTKLSVYTTEIGIDLGLVIKDWRSVVRIANIDVTDLTADASSGPNLANLMQQAIDRLPLHLVDKAVFYCNRTINTYLTLQVGSKSNNMFAYGGNALAPTIFNAKGVPIKRQDCLLETEATVA